MSGLGLGNETFKISVPAVVVVLIAVVTFVLVYVFHFAGGPDPENESTINTANSNRPALSPQALKQLKEEMTKRKDYVDIESEGQTFNVHLAEVVPLSNAKPKLDILLLHGSAFTSADWVEIKTVFHLANWGYRAVAIDLPGGRGKTTGSASDTKAFLTALISKLNLRNVVIISPSASGRFSLPYLFSEPETSTDRAVGYVPIAPVRTDRYVEAYKKSKLPTLIMYGDRDTGLGLGSLEDLRNLPVHQIAVIPEAGHACYIDQPQLFHNALYNWLSQLKPVGGGGGDADCSAGGGTRIDPTKLPNIPHLSLQDESQMKKESEKQIDVEADGRKFKVHLSEVVPLSDAKPKLDILLLHGAAFSSADWVEIKIVFHLANWGYRAVAIDLPGGVGQTTGSVTDYKGFLGTLISKLNMRNVVIISPSLSGQFSMPFLFSEPEISTYRAKGFVPVAPVSTGSYIEQFKRSKLPTINVYGDRDNGHPAVRNIPNLPVHQIAEIPNAGHPCYIDQPELFHKVLYYWLNELLKC